ncbi:MAG TPA: PLP-dependent aminotransferase family protein, partial [Ignisphaera aggregans]|nr:PLP-dependent aminotransferase family protein [Ignisphaera aggregans]
SGRVIYLGSFSKILSPGMRLGHIVAPQPLIDVFERAKQSMDLHTPTLTQYIAAEALKRRVIENNLPKIKRLYVEKRDAMLEALEEHFVKSAWWTKPIGGMFVWVKLNADIDTSDLLKKAVERGVAYVPGKAFYHDGSGVDTMRLNFTYPSIEDIRRGVEILASVVREALGHG